jgi:UDP-N-acetyl-D-mannosaminuronic acid dehydrogenase
MAVQSQRPRQSVGYDIAVVGGGGHAGAPLSILLASAGFRVLIHDRNQAALDRLALGHMPFAEAGGAVLLRDVLHADRLHLTSDPADVAGVPNVILTIGTPIEELDRPVTGALVRCVDELLPYLDDGACIIVRSTVAPGSTAFLDRHLRECGKSLLVAFCPERAVQGAAIEEMRTLAQIVSGASAEAVQRARAIFAKVAPEIVELSVLEAEYAKLICNAYRYIEFAATNQFFMMVESAGLDYHRLLDALKRGYPRMHHLPRAGFAGGPCLTKDTALLFAAQRPNYMLGNVAMTINEGLPDYIVSRLAQTCALESKTVGILGMAFKAESDDARSSLSYKLGDLLRFRGAVVNYSDEYVADAAFLDKEQLIDVSEIIIIAVPHNAYKTLKIPATKIVVDTCGCLAGR